MNKYDLSILIPSRNEMFLANTVQDILRNKRGKTEIIIHLDGAWSDPPIPSHPDVTIIYSPEAIGQRAGTNKACRLSQAKYIMKADAHLAFDEGFDVKLMEKITDDMTIVPMMRNLHVFDWVCEAGHRRYQSPSGVCKECGKETKRDVVWKAKESPRSTAFRFDKTLHFQYFNEFKKRPEGQGELTETLSLQGSCFMLTRDKYWELNICDEEFGSWGQQGVEVACKTWLSGGRVMCLQSTWYAHMFRTQGGDFSFPYPQSGRQIDHARKYSRDLFMNDKWPLAKHTFQWLLDKFAPVPEWHDDIKIIDKSEKKYWQTYIEKQKKGIIFYTDNKVPLKIAHKVQKNLRNIGLLIVSASLKPMPKMGTNIHIPLERGKEAYYTQIIAALEKSTAKYVFMCEHDVLYHPSHFDFTPERDDIFYFNQNFWRIRPFTDNFAVHWNANQVSGLCCNRLLLLAWYKDKFAKFKRGEDTRSYEPGNRDPNKIQVWKSKYPNIDIRGDWNLTRSKWSLADFRDKSTAIGWEESTIDDIPGWKKEQLNFLPVV